MMSFYLRIRINMNQYSMLFIVTNELHFQLPSLWEISLGCSPDSASCFLILFYSDFCSPCCVTICSHSPQKFQVALYLVSSPSAANLRVILLTNMNSSFISLIPLFPLYFYFIMRNYSTNLLFAPQKSIKLIFSSQESYFLCHDGKTENNIKILISAILTWVQSLLMKMINIASFFPSPLPSVSFYISVVSSGLYISCFMWMCVIPIINNDCCPFWTKACRMCQHSLQCCFLILNFN